MVLCNIWCNKAQVYLSGSIVTTIDVCVQVPVYLVWEGRRAEHWRGPSQPRSDCPPWRSLHTRTAQWWGGSHSPLSPTHSLDLVGGHTRLHNDVLYTFNLCHVLNILTGINTLMCSCSVRMCIESVDMMVWNPLCSKRRLNRTLYCWRVSEVHINRVHMAGTGCHGDKLRSCLQPESFHSLNMDLKHEYSPLLFNFTNTLQYPKCTRAVR